MSDTYSYTQLPEEDRPARRVGAKFNALVHAYNKRPKLPMLARSTERELISLVQDQGCTQSMDHLVECHMGFLVNIASNAANYNGMDDHKDDLFSEAAEGFMKAIRKFDLSRSSARLSTLGKYYASANCYRYIMDLKYAFRIGTNLPDKKAFYATNRMRVMFHQTYGRNMTNNPADIEAAAYLARIPVRAVKRMLEIETSGPALCVDDIQIHDGRTMSSAEGRVAARSGREALDLHINKIADTLIDRDRDIVLTMIADHERRTELASICAKRHNISTERVRQIYRGALSDIRASLQEDDLKIVSDLL